jgi:hypothetical protein
VEAADSVAEESADEAGLAVIDEHLQSLPGVAASAHLMPGSAGHSGLASSRGSK